MKTDVKWTIESLFREIMSVTEDEIINASSELPEISGRAKKYPMVFCDEARRAMTLSIHYSNVFESLLGKLESLREESASTLLSEGDEEELLEEVRKLAGMAENNRDKAVLLSRLSWIIQEDNHPQCKQNRLFLTKGWEIIDVDESVNSEVLSALEELISKLKS